MSTRTRKSSGQSVAVPTPSTSGNADMDVPFENFMLRIIAERKSSGKRQIRPKQVCDELIAEESDDPDFEMNDSAHEKNGSDSNNSDDSDSSDDDSSDGNNENGDSSKESDSDSEGESDTPVLGNSSSLRAAVKRMKEDSPEFNIPRKKKRQRKPKSKKVNNDLTVATLNSQGPESNNISKSPGKSNSAQKSKPKTSKSSKKSKAKTIASVSDKKKSKKKLSKRVKKRKSKYNSISELVNDISASTTEIRRDLDWQLPVCAACLSYTSDSSNEIFECDSCRLTVHEGCYIFDDNLSVSSRTDSSSSTEPWFCDACRNDLTDPTCELCPNSGGLFKETSDGRWVHLICTLYNPDIILYQGKTNLSDIPYSRFGNRSCEICENERYENVGMCVRCDAGMCRFATHATCAQKVGLLSNPINEKKFSEAADPYFMACKGHTNSDIIRNRLLNYQRLQEQVRIKRLQKSYEQLTEDERNSQSAIQQKLDKIRRKVEANDKELLSRTSVLVSKSTTKKSILSPDLPRPGTSKNLQKTNHFLIPKPNTMVLPGFVQKKKSRMLYTSALAVAAFENKAERMGLDLRALELEDKNERLVVSVSKKVNIHPALNVEYAAYYADREVRIDTIGAQCERLNKENYALNDKQVALNQAFENEALSHMEIMEETFRLDDEINKLKNILKKLVPGNKRLNAIRGADIIKLKSPPRRTSPSQQSRSKSPKGRGTPKSRGKNGIRKPFTGSPPPGRLSLFSCALCNKSDLQHLITRCDHCRKHFHLGCLDPPLTRMPKKSRLCGWMCSDCGDIDLLQPDQKVDTEAPRELRGRTKIKRPAKYSEIDESDIDEEFFRREQKFLGPLAATHPIPIPGLNSPIQARVKMEPLSNGITNANTGVFKGDGSPSPSPAHFGTADDTKPVPLKPTRRARTTRRRKPAKPRQPRLKKETSEKNKEKPEKTPPKKKEPTPKKRKATESPATESAVAVKKTRRASGHSGVSQSSIAVIDLDDVVETSPVTSGGLTAAEKNKVDARSSFGFLDATVKHGLLAIGQAQTGVWMSSTSSNRDLTSPLISSPMSSPDQQHPSVKKSRKQQIIAKDTVNTSTGSSFWNDSQDLTIITSPPLPNSFNYNSDLCHTSPLAGKCDGCGKSDNAKGLVTCDKCKLEFHFSCLKPPLKYTPKRRGYSWFCENCDETSSVEICNGD